MMTATRLGYRTSRSELIWATALSGAIAAGLAITALASASVFASHQPCNADLVGSGCGGILERLIPWYSIQQSLVALLWILPTGLGALLGVMITARELELRSAHIGWSIAISRRRWLFLRVVVPAIALVALLALCAGAAELVTRARLVTDQPGFVDYHLRSILVPLRGLLAFAVGIAVGANLGRTLPALLVAVVTSAAITIGLLVLAQTWQASGATFISLDALSATEYPLVVFPGELEWAQGRGAMAIPVADFGYWLLLEASTYAIAVAGVTIVADAVVRTRSPR